MAPPVCIFKVALQDDKKIWRRVAVRRAQTLDHLHNVIFDAFDRYDPHLYSFYFPRPGAKGRAALRDAEEYTSPVGLEPNSYMGMGKAPGNAARAKLLSLDLEPGQSFLYLFDFGDSWWHTVTVEDTHAPAQPGRYPRILEKRGESPPQYEPLPDEDEEDDA